MYPLWVSLSGRTRIDRKGWAALVSRGRTMKAGQGEGGGSGSPAVCFRAGEGSGEGWRGGCGRRMTCVDLADREPSIDNCGEDEKRRFICLLACLPLLLSIRPASVSAAPSRQSLAIFLRRWLHCLDAGGGARIKRLIASRL